MNVCFVNDADFIGGGERWIERAGRHLVTRGHQVSVACRHASPLARASAAHGLRVFGYSAGMDTKAFERDLRRFIEEGTIDLVHCTVSGSAHEAIVLDRIIGRINRVQGKAPVAVILKTGLPPLEHASLRTYGAGAGPSVRRLHVVSPAMQRAFETSHPSMSHGFVEVAYEGVDLDWFSATAVSCAEARRRLRLDNEARVMACVGRLDDAMKGQSVLLRTLPALRERHPTLTALFAGAGDDRELLEHLACDLGLGDCVRFVGHVDDVRDVLAAADVLCHPSMIDGIPNAVVEAMAMETAVVASRVGGMADIVDSERTGVLVRPNDVCALEHAVGGLLDDERRRVRLAVAARAQVVEHFDIVRHTDHLAQRFAEELSDLARAPRRRSAPPWTGDTVKTRVLFLFNCLRTGGEETEVAILARHLHATPYTLSVLSATATDEACPALEKLAAWQVDVNVACHSMPTDREKARYITDLIEREHIAIVVACQDATLAYMVFDHVDPQKCRLIEHGGVPDDVHRIAKDRTTRYVAVSPAIAAAAAAVMPRPADALFIPSMVDADEYDAPAWATARAENRRWLHDAVLTPSGMQDACIVTCAGRLDARKRFHDFIAAAERIAIRHPKVVFLVLGGTDAFQPEYAPWLYAQGAGLVAAGRLHFLGARGDVPGLLAASHVFVHVAIGEGMAHVISEAGAAGLAVVASDDGAAREQLGGGECGLVVPPGDIDALTGAIECLVADSALRRDLGARLKARVLGHYEARAVSAKWATLFRDVQREMSVSRPSSARRVRTQTSQAGDNSLLLGRTRAALRGRLSGESVDDLLWEYIAHGKMIRADVLFSASTCVGGNAASAVLAAQAIELLHSATLFHDDIIDQASERRGLPSLHHRVGIGGALVLGDQLIVRAVTLLGEARREHPAETIFRALEELDDAVRRCCRGQFRELEASPWISEEEYETIVRGKTGAPFVAAAVLGALFGGGSHAAIESLRVYGDAVGLAYQIADDLLDALGEDWPSGKPAGNSLRRGRPMLPIIYLIRSGPPSVRAALQALADRDWPRGELRDLMHEHGIVDRIRSALARHVARAVGALSAFGDNPGAGALRELAERVSALTFIGVPDPSHGFSLPAVGTLAARHHGAMIDS